MHANLRSRRSSGLFVAATLAVAIAACTVIFSFVDALLLEPLPMGKPDRVVLVFAVNDRQGVSRGPTRLSDFLDWRLGAASFEELAASEEMSSSSLGTSDGPIPVGSRRVTGSFARAWGLEAALGRTLLPGDDSPSSPPVVVLSHGFWERRFGADPGVLGEELRLDGTHHTVVGVMTPELEIGELALTEVWRPLPLAGSEGGRRVQVTGLLQEGVSPEAAEAELAALGRGSISDRDPEERVRVVRFAEGMAIPGTWATLGLAAFAVALVVLVACANVASLLLARAWDRRRETAVRLALGASRWQITRPILGEALRQALAAGLGGILLARAGLVLVRAVAHHPFFEHQVALDRTVLLFTLTLSLATPLFFALGPALHQSRLAAGEALRAGARGIAATRATRRAQGGLVVLQLALSLALLVVCLLALSAASRFERAELGFETEDILLVRVDLPDSRYREPWQAESFSRDLLLRLARIPGVSHAAATSRLPLVDRPTISPMEIQGQGAVERGTPWVVPAAVSPGYFAALGIEVLEGESFSSREGTIVLSEETALRYWGSRERALGARVRVVDDGSSSPWLDVVGIVSDVRGALEEERRQPEVYVRLADRPGRSLIFLLRGPGAGGEVPRAAREAVRGVDAELAVSQLLGFDEALEGFLSSDRLVALFFGGFALVALALASTGLYAVQSFSVARRRGELALRMVLGASPLDVLSRVVGGGVLLAAMGIGLGAPLALLMARVLRSAVGGAETSLPMASSVGAILGIAAVVASLRPALRAAGIDLASAMKSD